MVNDTINTYLIRKVQARPELYDDSNTLYYNSGQKNSAVEAIFANLKNKFPTCPYERGNIFLVLSNKYDNFDKLYLFLIVVAQIKTHWRSLRDQYKHIFNDEFIQCADIDSEIIVKAKGHKKMLMMECAFLNEIYRRKKQNGANDGISQQKCSTQESSYDSEIVKTANSDKSCVIECSTDSLNADPDIESNNSVNYEILEYDHQSLFDNPEAKLSQEIINNLFDDGMNSTGFQDRQELLVGIEHFANGKKPVAKLQEIASHPLVKQAAGYVMDASLILEKDSIPQNPPKKKKTTSNTESTNVSPATTGTRFMDETVVITDIILSIKSGSKRAVALAKIMEIGSSHNKK